MAIGSPLQPGIAIVVIIGDSNSSGLPTLVLLIFSFIMLGGFAVPCVQILALVHHGHEAATAAIPMACTMAAVAFTAALVLIVVVQPRRVPPISR
jgi:DHA1 family bicyclomycin/chloramphenicol resistance-like MFS transporter